jgi:hypothetical protein
MPEEIEVDTDKLREQIDHEIEESGGGRLLRLTALTTAMLAAIAAVASLKAGATVNDAILLKTEATQLQSRASDQWAYYQAKGIKGAVAASSIESWRATGKAVPAELTSAVARYTAQQDSIMAAAKALEHERDTKIEEADRLLEHHHAFANAVALLQVAIALGAVAALTRSKAVLGGSWLAGGIGAVIFFLNLTTK